MRLRRSSRHFSISSSCCFAVEMLRVGRLVLASMPGVGSRRKKDLPRAVGRHRTLSRDAAFFIMRIAAVRALASSSSSSKALCIGAMPVAVRMGPGWDDAAAVEEGSGGGGRGGGRGGEASWYECRLDAVLAELKLPKPALRLPL